MRRLLDNLYWLALVLSALCLVAIAILVGSQLGGRLVDGALKLVGLPVYGFVVLSLAEMAGYLLAASSFLALAGTLKSGAHIRVTMLLAALSEQMRRYVELWAFGAAAIASAYITYYLTNFAWVSFRFHEVSPGVIRVQLVYPQAAMAVGAIILTIALIDEFFIIVNRGRPSFRAAEDAISLGKES
ncbi:MAG: TRAP transporter small permease subunit [Rhizobiales bacterium]|nr:TRAP transporter small permease subunit [Hyphomicrobiales bacterium]